MSFNIERPSIQAQDDRTKIKEIISYLWKLSEELSFSLNSISTIKGTSNISTETDAMNRFNINTILEAVRNSTDILDKYYTTINEKMKYVYSTMESNGENNRNQDNYSLAINDMVRELRKDIVALASQIEGLKNALADLGYKVDFLYDNANNPDLVVEGNIVTKSVVVDTSDGLKFLRRN